ncbi:MAG: MoxR family ATPase [Lachnospiraceae bacterium]|nr:MoxR family ATPase [Lachnospiraceae bacterium]
MKQKIEKLRESICSVIVGREETIDFLLTALLADGHVLLEDVPGTGKTKLARTLAGALGITFSRIQFTPDLLPTDLTGLHVYDQQENQFVLHKGPVFTNILLADEINRATPRTQSGLLECMEEHQVTLDGKRMALAEPFFVIATQNPIETAGTFPLPEAQLDRFMMKLSLGLSSREEEIRILERFMGEDPIKQVTPVLSEQQLLEARREAAGVYVAPVLLEYLAELVEKTRTNERIRMGVSTRGSLAMLRAARSYAYLQGRSYVIPDDIKKLAVPVFAHRLVLAYGGTKEQEARELILTILDSVAVPTEDLKQ